MLRNLSCIAMKNNCGEKSEFSASFDTETSQPDIIIPVLVDLIDVENAYPVISDDGQILDRTYISTYSGSIFCVDMPYVKVFKLVESDKKAE